MRRSLRSVAVSAVVATAMVAGIAPASAIDRISTPDTAGVVGLHVSLALDAAGNPVVAYFDTTNDDLKILHCNDPDCAGNDESITSPDTAGTVGEFASLVLDAAGNPVVSYRQTSPTAALKIMHCNDPDCAGNNESITSPDTTAFPGSTSLRLDPAGNPVVAYVDNTDFDLKILHCNDVNCAGNDDSVTAPDTGFLVDADPSLELDGSGHPIVAYFDLSNQDLKVMRCNDADCAGGNESFKSPWTTGDVGWGPSLRLDSAGDPVIAFADVTNSKLLVLRCVDPTCTLVDSLGSAPVAEPVQVEQLALDASDRPVMAYYTQIDADLNVSRCDDTKCFAGGDTRARPDTVGDVGGYADLVLDDQDLPVVAYYDATNGNLKILRCDDPGCLPPLTLHVDEAAAGDADGSSWANTFTDLQDALAAANSGDTILIAEGTYIPDASDRAARFVLLDDVTIVGGYATGGVAGPDNSLYPTILSGDLAGNDTANLHPSDPTRADNAYNVVRAEPSSGSSSLAQVTITGGNANGSGSQAFGGGLVVNGADVLLDHVDIVANSGIDGAGVRIGQSTGSVLRAVSIAGNRATGDGGGVLIVEGSEAAIVNSNVDGNLAGGAGGGVLLDDADADLVTTVVSTNQSAAAGGGLAARNDSAGVAVNSVVSGNQATSGGGFAASGSSWVLRGVTVADNEASGAGGGIYLTGASPVANLINSIVWGNTASSGPGLSGNDFIVSFSDVQGGAPGAGNIAVDPQFVAPGSGNYRLQTGSPAIDSGFAFAIADAYDVDGDLDIAENTPDLDLEDRTQGGSVDMGAHEGGEAVPLFCNGLAVTVDLNLGDSPTSGHDVILGTPGPDVINALGGNDTICGERRRRHHQRRPRQRHRARRRRGRHRLRIDRRRHPLRADTGNDTIQGNTGVDTINGGDGDDTLSGNEDDDTINGDAGDDTIYGGVGRRHRQRRRTATTPCWADWATTPSTAAPTTT